MTPPRAPHRFADELTPPRTPLPPIRATWRDVGEIVAGVVVMTGLLLGLPFLLWLIGGA